MNWFAGTLQYQRSGCDKQFTGAPFRLKNICPNGVPPRSGWTSGTTTPPVRCLFKLIFRP